MSDARTLQRPEGSRCHRDGFRSATGQRSVPGADRIGNESLVTERPPIPARPVATPFPEAVHQLGHGTILSTET